MGNDTTIPKKKMSLEDAIIEMKIQSKQVMRMGKKAQKESEKYRKQAKDALKKNNEDFAKLYITSASQKHNEALSFQRTGIKMQIMCGQAKSMERNQKMVVAFSNMAEIANQQMTQLDGNKMLEQMSMFNQKMDEVIINDKLMQEMMNSSETADTNADAMMDSLKQDIVLEEQNSIPSLSPNTYKNGNNPVQYQKEGEESHDPFLDQLRGL